MKLIIVALFATLFIFTQAQVSVLADTLDTVDKTFTDEKINSLRKDCLNRANAYRRSLTTPLPDLKFSAQAFRLAQQHALFLAKAGWVSGKTTHYKFGERVAGYGGGAENVAYNFNQKDASTVLNQWIKSAGHERNLRTKLGYLGCGAVKATNNRVYWVQIFVGKDNPTSSKLFSYNYEGINYGTLSNLITPYPGKPTGTTPKPTRPTVKPTRPTVKPTRPTVKPTRPTVKPTRPTVKPTRPTRPTRPTVKPTRPTNKPSTPKPAGCRYNNKTYKVGTTRKTKTWVFTCLKSGKWRRKCVEGAMRKGRKCVKGRFRKVAKDFSDEDLGEIF